ncbi:MAG TPA: glutaredoxin family protein [Chloroflexota bacterium]|nr:glutaredoxin family protein [Chloroflexota bacterium]
MKEFLSQCNVAFTVRDLNVDSEARAEFIASGYTLPPVTVVNGQAVFGFDPERLLELLARYHEQRTPTTPSESFD